MRGALPSAAATDGSNVVVRSKLNASGADGQVGVEVVSPESVRCDPAVCRMPLVVPVSGVATGRFVGVEIDEPDRQGMPPAGWTVGGSVTPPPDNVIDGLRWNHVRNPRDQHGDRSQSLKDIRQGAEATSLASRVAHGCLSSRCRTSGEVPPMRHHWAG